MNSLHKMEGGDKLPLYLFLDSTRCGEAEDDTYVFSTSTERLDYGTERAVIAVLEPKWRESSKPEQKVRLDIRGGWVQCKAAHLTAIGGGDIAVVTGGNGNGVHRDTATYAAPRSATSVSVSLDADGCTHAAALLSCSVPLDPSHSELMWRQGAWNEVDLLHQGNTTFANLAWITERIPPLESMGKWTKLDTVKVS
jgi:hypothetical protein